MNNAAIKVSGDWELDVRAIPFGVVDSDGQWFSEKTNLMEEYFPTPPVVYYHGYTPDGTPQSEPETIGKIVSRERREDGVWVRVALDKTKELAKRIWDAARRGLAAASSGSIWHLARVEGKPYRKDKPGEITTWGFAELSLIDIGDGRAPANRHAVAVPVLKSVYEQAGLSMPDIISGDDSQEASEDADEINADNNPTKTIKEEKQEVKMDDKKLSPEEIQAQVRAAVEAALNAEKAKQEEEAALKKAEEERIAKEVEKRLEEYKAEAAKNRRLPFDGAPYVTRFAPLSKYDNVESGDLALGIEILNGISTHNRRVAPAAKAMYQALAVRALESTDKSKDEAAVTSAVKAELRKTGFSATKADEVMQQDLTSYGDEWVGVGYGTRLWEMIRADVDGILSRIPSIEIPQGFETFYDPIEGADPTWYKVPEVTDENSTTKTPNATVPSSRVGTSRANETLAKAGARVQWSGELNEDSLIPMLPEIRRKLVLSGRETLLHVIIDGDTAAGASTNINNIAGTPAGTEAYLLVNGFRKLALVTNTANSRSASGGFVVEDFINTVKLMGLGGKNALDREQVAFIIDPHTHWKALGLPEVKTRDVFSAPTVENGQLTNIYGYRVYATPFMHYANQDATYGLKANIAGKVDLNTAANNLYGAILAVRFDQWKFGWKRRMTIETERIARADLYEIVALMRFGLKYRDNEAAAITYYVGV